MQIYWHILQMNHRWSPIRHMVLCQLLILLLTEFLAYICINHIQKQHLRSHRTCKAETLQKLQLCYSHKRRQRYHFYANQYLVIWLLWQTKFASDSVWKIENWLSLSCIMGYFISLWSSLIIKCISLHTYKDSADYLSRWSKTSKNCRYNRAGIRYTQWQLLVRFCQLLIYVPVYQIA